MIRRLTKIGNSYGLILSKDLRDHLGITDEVEVIIREGEIVLRRPMSLDHALEHSETKFGDAFSRLSDV